LAIGLGAPDINSGGLVSLDCQGAKLSKIAAATRVRPKMAMDSNLLTNVSLRVTNQKNTLVRS